MFTMIVMQLMLITSVTTVLFPIFNHDFMTFWGFVARENCAVRDHVYNLNVRDTVSEEFNSVDTFVLTSSLQKVQSF
jgi:hypothetical protein